MRTLSFLDKIIMQVDGALNTVFSDQSQTRPNPADDVADVELTAEEQRKSQGFMRVNHTGEVCAQALYRGQLAFAKEGKTADMLEQAAIEETDHLAWTHQRLQQLDTHRSYLNFFWYVKSFGLGMLAAKCGDKWSLGFVEETERQVSDHLTSHLDRLPEADLRSRAIVEQMRDDEEQHGAQAKAAGAQELPTFVKCLMTLQSKVMTTIAYYL
ncbi:MAG: demethoxyubiquinone hydroxylase family protein [Coxiella sp. (in: Bacteria)]|nr:MAG: demethoxyubiquinone hydroxylase family protein [Coxiella sp. (in: g-proteobacteria)]